MALEEARLIRRIQRAWSDAQRPAPRRICDLDDAEGEDIRRTFKGLDWRQCTETRTGGLLTPLTLIYMEPEGIRYYLPAFMIHAIRTHQESSWIASVLKDVEFREHLRELSREQLKAVRDFLKRQESDTWCQIVLQWIEALLYRRMN